MTLTSFLILLFATLAPAAVLLGAGVWALIKEPGDLTRALGLAAIIGGLMLVILAILLWFLIPAPATDTIVS